MSQRSPRQQHSSTSKCRPRWIEGLFPLLLQLACSVLLGPGLASAGDTPTYGTGSCTRDDHWAKAKTDPDWTCQINIPGFGLGGVSEQTLDYADHHILIAKDGAADPCSVDNTKGKLPTGTPKFCFKVGNEVRGVWNWSNTSKLNRGSLNWLQSVEQIGSSTQTAECKSELTVAGRCPNRLSNGQAAFYNMGGEGGSRIRDLDTSNLEDMSYMFQKASRFNEDISAWDTSSVTNMRSMFSGASAFNRDINTKVINPNTADEYTAWDTSLVDSMGQMFANTATFDQDIGEWDTSRVRMMDSMFASAAAFNQDIGEWDTSRVITMEGMFAEAAAFNQDIGGWATRIVSNMDYMFGSYDVPTSFNQDLSGWDVRLIEGEPEWFRLNTEATWAGIAGTAWCNEGQPQWGTDGTSGCSTAQAPDEIIEAIMGGGTVIGTECVNGKVDELVSSDAIIDFGPDLTLFVKPAGKTRLRKDAGYKWVNGTGDSNKDKVNFIRVDTGKVEGVAHYLSSQTAVNEVAEFGTSAGGPAAVIQGQGTHQMQFVSQTRQVVTLGTMYTAEEIGGFPMEYSCVPPDLLPPDKPTNVVAEAHASGGMLVEFVQDGPGGDPTSYTFEAQLKDAAGGGVRRGDVVDTEGKPDTSSPFLITPTPPFSDNPGEWRIRITAVNAAGEATSDWSNYITPSVEEPPVPDAPVITGVTTSNGKATISFIAPEDYGEAITNYAYRLTGKFDDPELFETLNPPIVKSPITVAGLVNGKTYTVSIAAINANGTGPDSNEEEFTVGTECDAVTDWTAPANTMGYFCSIGLDDYAYADFHILTTDGTEVCAARATYLPTGENNNQGLFCAQEGNTVRAIYNWNNKNSNKKLTWLTSVEQIGSRSQGSACEDADETVAGRCANQLVDGNRAFISMAGVGGTGIVNLDTSNLSSFYAMFGAAKNFNENIGAWDTTGVKEMGEMFAEASSFDQDIGDWDTSNVEKMRVMFAFASSFNKNIGDWDTSTVRDMTLMFDQAAAFNQDLHQWDVSNIDSKPNYFDRGTDNWTGIDPVLGSKWCNDGRPRWGTDGTQSCVTQCSEVTDWPAAANDLDWRCEIDGQPYEYADFHILTTDGTDVCAAPATYLPTPDNDGEGLFCAREGDTVRAIYDWNNYFGDRTEKELTWLLGAEQIGSRSVTADLGCEAEKVTAGTRCANQLASGDHAFYKMAGDGGTGIRDLDVSNLNDLYSMFTFAKKFNQPIGGWDTSAVTKMRSMFSYADVFDQYIGDWNTSKVTSMGKMFNGTDFFNQDISTKTVTRNGSTYTAWDTSQVTDMHDMFRSTKKFNQPIGNWDTSSVTDMQYIFYSARAFNQPIGDWDTSNVKKMGSLFRYTYVFNQDISEWDTANVTDMYRMFSLAKAFNLDISPKTVTRNGRTYTAWDTSEVTRMEGTFKENDVFNRDISGWNTAKVTNMKEMFKNARAFNQDLSGWNVEAVTDHDDFDEGADAWCGLGFANRGRPGNWDPLSDGVSCPVSLSFIDVPPSVVAGDELTYTLQYFNESSGDSFIGTLTLTLPPDVTAKTDDISAGGTQSGRTITWRNVEVPAGSSADGGGGEVSVTVKVSPDALPSTEANPRILEANATLSAGGVEYVNDVAETELTSEAILMVTLEANEQVMAGELITYAISVRNDGLSRTQNAVINLTLVPEQGSAEAAPNFSFEDDAGVCEGTVCNWTNGNNLEPGGERTATVSVRIADDAEDGSRFKAMLNANSGNNADTSDRFAQVRTEVTAVPAPALRVTLTTLPEAVVGTGDPFHAIVEVSNTGAAAADETTVTLNVPEGASFNSAMAGGIQAEEGGVITWSLTELEVGKAVHLDAYFTAPALPTALALQATASTVSGGNDVRDTVTESLMVTGMAVLDLQLVTDPKDKVGPGDLLDLEFRFENRGNDDAENVTLSMLTPADTALDWWPDYASCPGTDDGACIEGYTGEVLMDLGTMASGENDTAMIGLTVAEAPTTKVISISGSLVGEDTDEGGSLPPQSASAEILIAEPSLAVSQRVNRATVARGQTLVYDITYQNLSSEAVAGVDLVALIPTDTRVVAAPGALLSDDKEISWSTAELGGGESGRVLLEIEVQGNAAIGVTLDNVVTIAAGDELIYAEPAGALVVADAANIESWIDNPDSTRVGDEFSYTVNYANAGNESAESTTLQIQLADDVSLVDCDDCKVNGGRLTWSLGNLAADNQSSKSVRVAVNAGAASEVYALSYISDGSAARGVAGSIDAKLAALRERRTAADADKAIDIVAERSGPVGVSSIKVGAAAQPALSAPEITAPERAVAGQEVAVRVTFANAGGAAANDVTLTSTVPSYATATALGGGQCSATPCSAGETITWPMGVLAAGSNRSVSYTLSSDATAVGQTLTHRVSLDSAESRPAPQTKSTQLLGAVLSIDKRAVNDDGVAPTFVTIGEQLRYTLTVGNDSPVAQQKLTVVDHLPAAIVACGSQCLAGAQRGGFAADAGAGTLTWSGIDLPANTDITLAYDVTIPSLADNTTLQNLANVSSATGSSDSSSATVTVAAKPELGLALTAPAVLQDGAEGSVTLTYQNTGTAATNATLRYVLPGNATMVDAAGATVSAASYSWDLGSLAAGATGAKVVTVKANGAANSTMLHTASVSGSGTSASAEAQTTIGVREELALTITAPVSVDTGDAFTATIVASNTGNAAANGTAVNLTVPSGFSVSGADGGTASGQQISWTLDLVSGASVTLSPTLTAPAAADTRVLLAELSAASGKTQSASVSVRVTVPAAAIIQAGVQFSVAEAMAGDQITLKAGPANVGDAASGQVDNVVTLASGLAPIGTPGAIWNSVSRTLSWSTDSVAAQSSDAKQFTLRVEDAGPLSASLSSSGATGEARMVRTFPEEVIIKPGNPNSTCKLSGQPLVQAAPTPPAGITLSFANTVGFTVIDCDRNPNTTYPETLSVTIDVGQSIDPGAALYKISDGGGWSLIETAVIAGDTVTYSITDDGDLDQDKTPGTLRDPVALAIPPVASRVTQIPSLPMWLLGLLALAVGSLGYRRLRAT